MSRILTLICILAVAALVCAPLYAEVQNVKVSGDITVRALGRANYDLDKDDPVPSTPTGPTPGDDKDAYFMQSVGLNVDADLTDNVSTAVRLINQRNWDNNSSGADTFDADIDVAYVTLKEMIYAPLTLTIGRQDLWFGRGLIIGSANLTSASVDAGAEISADEYSETTAFDAIKATLDLAPWKLDLVYSKVDENVVSSNDDTNLYGVNAGYKFDVYNAETEAYYFGKIDAARPRGTTEDASRIHTYGIRGSLEPITNLSIGAEGAIQRGRFDDLTKGNRSIRAYAFDAFGKYSFADVIWKPTLGIEWLALSGEDNVNGASDNDGKWHGWDAMYRGKYDTAIRDFQNYLYATRVRQNFVANTVWDQDSGMSNQNSLLITGSIVPAEDVTVRGTYAHFWLNDKPNTDTRSAMGTSDDVGDELDILLTYDYTEDVSFGLLTGWFFPGSYFPTGQDDTAADVVGSMKVVF